MSFNTARCFQHPSRRVPTHVKMCLPYLRTAYLLVEQSDRIHCKEKQKPAQPTIRDDDEQNGGHTYTYTHRLALSASTPQTSMQLKLTSYTYAQGILIDMQTHTTHTHTHQKNLAAECNFTCHAPYPSIIIFFCHYSHQNT